MTATDHLRPFEDWEINAFEAGWKTVFWDRLPDERINHPSLRNQVKGLSRPVPRDDCVSQNICWGISDLRFMYPQPTPVRWGQGRAYLGIGPAVPYGPGHQIFIQESFRLPSAVPRDISQMTPDVTNALYPRDNVAWSAFGTPMHVDTVIWGPVRPATEMPLGLCRLRMSVANSSLVRIRDIFKTQFIHSGLEYWESADTPTASYFRQPYERAVFKNYWLSKYGPADWQNNAWVLQTTGAIHTGCKIRTR